MTVFNSINFLNSKTKLSNNCNITSSEIIKQILSLKRITGRNNTTQP